MKKLIYNTVGTTYVMQEKLKELLEDLIQNQHYTEEEGKRIVDDFFYDIKNNVDNVKLFTQLKVDELLKNMNIDTLSIWKEKINNIVKDIENNPLLPMIINRNK